MQPVIAKRKSRGPSSRDQLHVFGPVQLGRLAHRDLRGVPGSLAPVLQDQSSLIRTAKLRGRRAKAKLVEVPVPGHHGPIDRPFPQLPAPVVEGRLHVRRPFHLRAERPKDGQHRFG
jgi:hypothetical protein